MNYAIPVFQQSQHVEIVDKLFVHDPRVLLRRKMI